MMSKRLPAKRSVEIVEPTLDAQLKIKLESIEANASIKMPANQASKMIQLGAITVITLGPGITLVASSAANTRVIITALLATLQIVAGTVITLLYRRSR